MGFEISGWPCCCSTALIVVVVIWKLLEIGGEKDDRLERRLKRSTDKTNELQEELAELRSQIDNLKTEDENPDSPNTASEPTAEPASLDPTPPEGE